MEWSVLKKNLSEIKWVYYIPLFILLIIFIVIVICKFCVVTEAIENLKNKIEVKRQGPVKARGIYISSWNAGEENNIENLVNFILDTNLNAAIIDIKDVTGKVSYKTNVELARNNHLYELRIKNIKELLNYLKSKGIYVIGRICVFKDDALAKRKESLALKNNKDNKVWKDYSDLGWVDPSSKKVWNYNISLAKEALSLGFEEINFDYIRFPSDGTIKDINYPVWEKEISKKEIIKSFFEYQHEHLKDYRVSADLFGMTMSHVLDGKDMNIGQRFEDAAFYFDYLCPMLYPSYFKGGFKDIKNPFEKPYEIINKSFKNADSVIKKGEKPFVRPWLQAFSANKDKISPEFLKLQKQAVLDNNSYGFLLWSSRNDYFDFKKVFQN